LCVGLESGFADRTLSLRAMTAKREKPKDKPFHSLFAGATAGAIEACVYHPDARNLADEMFRRFVTYPTEYVKTRSQFGGGVVRPARGSSCAKAYLSI